MQRVRTTLGVIGTIGIAVLAASAGARADATPSPTASAAGTNSPAHIVLSPTSGPPGSEVTVTGSGFPAGQLDLYLDLPSHPMGLFGSPDSNGAFVFVVTIYAPPGDHTICADSFGTPSSPTPQVTACDPFTVTAYQPVLTVTPASGPPHTGIVVTGSGFPPGELVALYIDSPNPFIGTPGPVADGQGNFSAAGGRMPGDAGPHSVCGDTGPPSTGLQQQFILKVCTAITVTGTSLPSPSPLPSFQAASPSPPPLPPSPSSTITTTPAAAQVTSPAFPTGPVAVLVAVVIAIGAGLYIWIRRRAQPPSF
jgi:hypothetical protein